MDLVASHYKKHEQKKCREKKRVEAKQFNIWWFPPSVKHTNFGPWHFVDEKKLIHRRNFVYGKGCLCKYSIFKKPTVFPRTLTPSATYTAHTHTNNATTTTQKLFGEKCAVYNQVRMWWFCILATLRSHTYPSFEVESWKRFCRIKHCSLTSSFALCECSVAHGCAVVSPKHWTTLFLHVHVHFLSLD